MVDYLSNCQPTTAYYLRLSNYFTTCRHRHATTQFSDSAENGNKIQSTAIEKENENCSTLPTTTTTTTKPYKKSCCCCFCCFTFSKPFDSLGFYMNAQSQFGVKLQFDMAWKSHKSPSLATFCLEALRDTFVADLLEPIRLMTQTLLIKLFSFFLLSLLLLGEP